MNEPRILVTLTYADALRLRYLLAGVVEGWNLGDAMIQHIAQSFPGDPPAISDEDKAQMQRDRELISAVLDQLSLKVLQ